jgi:hypothetical protein
VFVRVLSYFIFPQYPFCVNRKNREGRSRHNSDLPRRIELSNRINNWRAESVGIIIQEDLGLSTTQFTIYSFLFVKYDLSPGFSSIWGFLVFITLFRMLETYSLGGQKHCHN